MDGNSTNQASNIEAARLAIDKLVALIKADSTAPEGVVQIAEGIGAAMLHLMQEVQMIRIAIQIIANRETGATFTEFESEFYHHG